jgi:hypothetical protein
MGTTPIRSKLWRSLGALALAATLVDARAATQSGTKPAWAPDKWFVQAGVAEGTRMGAVGAMWQAPWLRDYEWGNVTGYFELSLGRWVSHLDDGTRSSAWVTQVGITPVLRWQPFRSSRWFTEAGIGVNLLDPIYRSSDKRFSTAFNFGDHVGIGVQFGEARAQELTLRLQHFSNAGIKDPNPGENFVQLRYSSRF